MNAIASEAVSTARAALHSAIRAGKDTLKPRRELTDAEQAQARERAANDRLLAQMEKARADAIGKSVEAECAQLRAEIEAECQAVLPGFPVAVSVESHRLVMLLEAKARADEIAAARAELQHDLENLNIRLAETQTAIGQLHAKPDRSEADNGQAHFLLLDQADIKALIEAATAQLEELTLPALGDLERGWGKAKADARHRALHGVVLELERRLIAVAHQIAADIGLADTANRYVPSAAMRQAVSRSIV